MQNKRSNFNYCKNNCQQTENWTSMWCNEVYFWISINHVCKMHMQIYQRTLLLHVTTAPGYITR